MSHATHPAIIVTGADLAQQALDLLTGYEVVYAGKTPTEDDMVALATQFSQAVQLLRDFYKSSGATDPAPVLAALRSHLESVAHHHFNVSGFSEPELDFAS